MPTFCQILADNCEEFVIMDSDEHADAAELTAGHEKCVELVEEFYIGGSHGRYIAGMFIREAYDLLGLKVDALLDAILTADDYGKITVDGPDGDGPIYVSDYVTECMERTEDRLSDAGYYVEWFDGVTVYSPVKG